MKQTESQLWFCQSVISDFWPPGQLSWATRVTRRVVFSGELLQVTRKKVMNNLLCDIHYFRVSLPALAQFLWGGGGYGGEVVILVSQENLSWVFLLGGSFLKTTVLARTCNVHHHPSARMQRSCGHVLPLSSSCAHTLKTKMQPKRAPASKKKTCGDNEFARILFDRLEGGRSAQHHHTSKNSLKSPLIMMTRLVDRNR